MRKLIYAINLTSDGCCDHTKGMPDEELYDYHKALLQDAHTFLYGRKTYQLMVPYWPDIAKDPSDATKDEYEFALAYDAVSQVVVFSQTLDQAEGEKTRIVRGNLEQEVLQLKQKGGKNILTGGVDIPTQLVELGLVDEFHFIIMPVIVGEGRRLFDSVNLPERLKLKLVDTKIFKSGCVALRYLKS
jgi:dihydrofolate reductase